MSLETKNPLWLSSLKCPPPTPFTKKAIVKKMPSNAIHLLLIEDVGADIFDTPAEDMFRLQK